MLKIDNLEVYYGAIHALKGVSLEVHENEIVSLIGANGAGKSTLLKAISGLVHPSSGNIEFSQQSTHKKTAAALVKEGVVHVPEGRRIFQDMSVWENLMMGAYLRKDKDQIQQDINSVYAYFPRLEERKNQLAGTLSGGEQQMLAIGRALMAKPKLLILDEPSMGLSPLLVKEIFAIIKEINAQGTTILLVEQNAKMALSISKRAYVMETGKIVLEGLSQELIQSEAVQKAYLGG